MKVTRHGRVFPPDDSLKKQSKPKRIFWIPTPLETTEPAPKRKAHCARQTDTKSRYGDHNGNIPLKTLAKVTPAMLPTLQIKAQRKYIPRAQIDLVYRDLTFPRDPRKHKQTRKMRGSTEVTDLKRLGPKEKGSYCSPYISVSGQLKLQMTTQKEPAFFKWKRFCGPLTRNSPIWDKFLNFLTCYGCNVKDFRTLMRVRTLLILNKKKGRDAIKGILKASAGRGRPR